MCSFLRTNMFFTLTFSCTTAGSLNVHAGTSVRFKSCFCAAASVGELVFNIKAHSYSCFCVNYSMKNSHQSDEIQFPFIISFTGIEHGDLEFQIHLRCLCLSVDETFSPVFPLKKRYIKLFFLYQFTHHPHHHLVNGPYWQISQFVFILLSWELISPHREKIIFHQRSQPCLTLIYYFGPEHSHSPLR